MAAQLEISYSTASLDVLRAPTLAQKAYARVEDLFAVCAELKQKSRIALGGAIIGNAVLDDVDRSTPRFA